MQPLCCIQTRALIQHIVKSQNIFSSRHIKVTKQHYRVVEIVVYAFSGTKICQTARRADFSHTFTVLTVLRTASPLIRSGTNDTKILDELL